jgi:branched-chain amino acid transport system substrate-binding protein
MYENSFSLNPKKLLELRSQKNREKKLRIGISGNLGGHTRELCVGSLIAVEEWLEESPPFSIQLIWEEDALNEQTTGKAAMKLVNKKVNAVIGHLSSTEAIAASKIYYEAKIPYLAPATSNPSLTKNNYNNLLRFFGTDDELSIKMVSLAKALDCKKLAIIYQKITYGKTLASLLNLQFQKMGLSSLVIPWNNEKTNIPDSIDCVLYAGTYQIGVKVLKFLQSRKYQGHIIMGDDSYIPDLIMRTKEASEGVYVISSYVDTDHPDYKNFYSKYVKKAGVSLGAYSITSYVATQMLLQSFEKTNDHSIESIISAIRHNCVTNKTLLGSLIFDKNGDLLNFPWATYKIQSGNFKKINL